MKKRVINPIWLNVFLTLALGLFLTVIATTMTDVVMKKMYKDTESRFESDYRHIVSGYSLAINSILKNYEDNINTIIDTDFISTATDDEIWNYMPEVQSKLLPEFNSLIYINSSGFSRVNKSQEINFSERPELKRALNTHSPFYISNTMVSTETGFPVFTIAKQIFGSNNKVKGIISGSISTSTLDRILNEMKISDESMIVLIDGNGRFISHQDKSWIFRKFYPHARNHQSYSSENVAHDPDGFIKTEDTDGNSIWLVHQKVSGTNWTVCAFAPESYIESSYVKSKHAKAYILGISISAFLIMILLESVFLHYLIKKQAIEQNYDHLTNLWTRQKFEKEATRLLKTYPNNKFMLVESDINRFKFINQNYSEDYADKVIQYFAKCLESLTENGKGIICRGYADHFYSFFRIKSVRDAMHNFEASLEALNESIKRSEIPFTPKFGISFVLEKGKNRRITIQQLIGHASFAKATVKENSLYQYSIYNSHLLRKINEEQYLEQHMEEALEKHEFFVVYQPKISLESEKIVGGEALVRWNNPKLGIISPDKFVPLFERNGFIKKLDFFVYEQVFKFIQNQLNLGQSMVPISVNMSRNHDKPDKFVHDFLELFNKYSIPADMVQLEIIERSFMDSATLEEITNRLHEHGFRVAMDDFGTGESSLNLITKLPIDILKFDRSFLTNSKSEDGKLDSESKSFIRSLINLSKDLKKETIFEGVETTEQKEFLKSINCDQVQGYFYSKPLMVNDFISYQQKNS